MQGWGHRAVAAALVVMGIVVGSGQAGLAAAPTAEGQATVTSTAIPSAHDEPDGVFVEWPYASSPSAHWRLSRTVGGITKRADLWTSWFSDTGLAAGQSATYTLAAYDGTQLGPESVVVSAKRLTSTWSPPAGARTAVVFGPEVPSASSVLPMTLDTVQFGVDWDSLVTNQSSRYYSFGYLPGPGTYRLSPTPAVGDVAFRANCASGSGSGQVVVHDVAYSATGKPLQVGADFEWSCGDGAAWHSQLRYNSPAPLVRVAVVGVGGQGEVVRGRTATAEYDLRNVGDVPARLGTISADDPYDVVAATSTSCNGVLLQPGQACRASVTLGPDAQVEPASYGYGVFAPVQSQSGAAGLGRVKVDRELASPVLTWRGRTTTAVQLGIDLPDLAQMQPLAGLRIERSVDGSAWTVAAQLAPTENGWTDLGLRVGTTVAYRISTVAESGEVTAASNVVSGRVPASAIMWGAGGFAGAGDPDDPGAVGLPQPAEGTVTGIAVSPDRSHLAVAIHRSGTNTSMMYITELGGGRPRLILSRTTDSTFRRLSYSPNGRSLAFTDGGRGPETVAVVDVASAVTQSLRSQGVVYGWSPDGAALLLGWGQEATGAAASGLRWVTIGSGAARAVSGTLAVPDENNRFSHSVVVSRTGDIVWPGSRAGGGQALYRVLASAAAATELWAPSGCQFGELAFAPTGSELAVAVDGSGCSAGTSRTVALAVPATGSAASWRPLVSFAARTMAWVTTTSAVPAVTVSLPAVTNASPTVRPIGTDLDDAIGGLSYTCRLDDGAWQSCGPAWALTRLAAGSHTVSVIAQDASGQRSKPAAKTWTVDAAGPTTSLTTPPVALLDTTLKLGWTGTDAGGAVVASYDVRERYASIGGTMTSAVYPAGWQALTSPSLAVKLSRGYTYCFSVRARDSVGNVGAFTPERCTSVSLDDRSLTNHGGARGTNANYVSGTFTRLAGTSQYVSQAAVRGTRIGVVVTTCSTCGAVDVFVGGVKWGRLDTVSSTTKYRQTLWLPVSATRSGALVVRPATSRQVLLDALLVQK